MFEQTKYVIFILETVKYLHNDFEIEKKLLTGGHSNTLGNLNCKLPRWPGTNLYGYIVDNHYLRI